MVPWKKLGSYIDNERDALMWRTGWLAERSASEVSMQGPKVMTQWIVQMRQVFSGILTYGSTDKTTRNFLNSPLSSNSKLKILGEFAPPSVWLETHMTPLVIRMLPKDDEKAFVYLTAAWHKKDTAINKKMVSTFLPVNFGLLDLALSEQQWSDPNNIKAFLVQAKRNTKSRTASESLELPTDFSHD